MILMLRTPDGKLVRSWPSDFVPAPGDKVKIADATYIVTERVVDLPHTNFVDLISQEVKWKNK